MRLVLQIASFLTALLAAATLLQGQQRIQVGENVLVSKGLEARPLIEPHLVAHPTDAHHLLGAVIVSTNKPTFYAEETCATFLSLDDGQSWTRHDFPVTHCADPWVSLSAKGTAVFTVLGWHRSVVDSAPSYLLAFTSSDGGRTWTDVPQVLGRGHDHETTVADAAGNAYVLSGQAWRDGAQKLRWAVFLARARAGSASFEVLHRFFPSNLNINAEGLAMLSDGALVISYSDFQRDVDDFSRAGWLDRPRTWMMISPDRGESFSIPLFVTESCGRSWAFVAADTAQGPHRDRLYHVCPNREKTAIQVSWSGDRGERWSDPVVVEPPTAQTGSRNDPQLAVSPQGVLGVSWLDGRDDAAGRCHALYFTASLDGGQNFLPSRRVAAASSCPDSSKNGPALKRWPRGGDYHGLAAGADGTFHAFWSGAGTGTFQLWTARVRVNPPADAR